VSRRLLVTGCRGFIGSSAGLLAARHGWELLGISRSSHADARWPGRHQSRDVVVDDLAGVVADFRPDVVLHAAGSASVAASMHDPLADLRGAVLSWANLLDGVRRSGTDPLVVFLSSAAVYGQPDVLPVAESAPTRPISPYGHHKVLCEQLAAEYAGCYGTRTLVTRVFSVLGPRQRRLLTYELAAQALGDAPAVTVRGTGDESRDFLHVDDVAGAILGLATSRLTGPLDVVNVASGRETTVRELAEEVSERAGGAKAVRYEGRASPGDPERWVADVSKLRSHLGEWSPRPVGEAVADCLSVWRPELAPVSG
jgi:UDP-glucose 4-epimerase